MNTHAMTLGNFLISLAVKDLESSRGFYQKLGFEASGGDGKRWLILRNGDAIIGLFQGMFDCNTLTFNPGWDKDCKKLDAFTDVREIALRVRRAGIEPVMVDDGGGKGPGSFMVVDPDGNPVLVDQHV